MKNKLYFYGFILILISSLAIAPTSIKAVFGLNDSESPLLNANQSVPTRTPTPKPQTPTNTPTPKPTKSNSGGGDTPATAVPTSTDQPLPTATATATPIITIAYTPVGGFVPTAEPCSNQPTLQALNPTNVRQGPGTNYPIIGKMVYLEVRFITGRAADAPWWLIQLENGANGWVADDVVTIQGYIGSVPIVSAPDIDGQAPTPGTPWSPTPQPGCTVIPTATATETATVTETATAVPPTATPNPTVIEPAAAATSNSMAATSESAATSDSTAANTPADTQPASESAANPEAPAPQPTQTAVAPPTLMPVTNSSQPEPISAAQPTVEPIEATLPRSSTDWLLPVAALLLVAGGVTSFVARRKK